MKKVLAFSAMALALSVFSCGDTGVNSGGGGGGSSGGYKLTTSASPSNGGNVSRSPDQSKYSTGTPVTLTATPNIGYTFTGWSGASSSTSPTITIYMNSDLSLTANFKQVSNAVIITLTSWSTLETDLLGDTKLDPKIYFNVISLKGGSVVSNNSTGVLLQQDNVGQSWSGSKRSSPVTFISSADELRIQAVVIEQDPLVEDDISPTSSSSWKPIPSSGSNGSTTIGSSAKGTSRVGYSYEFIWQ